MTRISKTSNQTKDSPYYDYGIVLEDNKVITHIKVTRMPSTKAVIKQLQGITFAAKSATNHWILMDGPEIFGGSNAGCRPKELLLFALGGCTASDVVPILKKKRVPLDGLEVHVTANAREEHPQVFTDIHIEYVFYGNDINTIDVERAIDLSTTKYCVVSAMLKGNVQITHSYRIEETTQSPVKELS
jgi:putative redox protein